MVSIVVIGSGNVAHHFVQAISKSKNLEMVQAYARKKENLFSVLNEEKIVDDWNLLAQADLYILAVSDDAVEEIAAQLPFENRLVVHTAGSLPMTVLGNKNRKGVLYPLQTFSKNKVVDFKKVPICIEAADTNDLALLQNVAESLSENVIFMDSKQRKQMHIAAVFVNNFVNHLYKIGADICEESKIPFQILQPLIQETANKVMQLSPNEAQTGPARRHDLKTIASHLESMTNINQKNIYSLLTQSIQENV